VYDVKKKKFGVQLKRLYVGYAMQNHATGEQLPRMHGESQKIAVEVG